MFDTVEELTEEDRHTLFRRRKAQLRTLYYTLEISGVIVHEERRYTILGKMLPYRFCSSCHMIQLLVCAKTSLEVLLCCRQCIT